jgi:hypothetical protein
MVDGAGEAALGALEEEGFEVTAEVEGGGDDGFGFEGGVVEVVEPVELVEGEGEVLAAGHQGEDEPGPDDAGEWGGGDGGEVFLG